MGSTAPHSQPPHILIVGAGIVGASIAYHLAHHPLQPTITVLAAAGGPDDNHATPNSFAWLNASYHNPRPYFLFRRRSIARWRALGEALPALGRLISWSGSLIWNLPPEDLDAYFTQHKAWGYDIHRIGKETLAQLEPNLDAASLPDCALHVTSAEEGSLEPAAAAQVLLASAQEDAGHSHARVIPDVTVTKILFEDSNDNNNNNGVRRCYGVETSTGETHTADHVILAAGFGTAALAATAGVHIPLTTPAPAGLLVHSKPVAPQLLRHVVYGPLGHVRQTVGGQLLGGSDFAGGDPGADPAATAREQFAVMQSGFVREAGVKMEMEGFTVGRRPTPVDGLPIVGPVGGGVEGLSVAVMHSGVTNAAAVGEVLAEYVLTGKKDAALEEFGLARFGVKSTGPQ